MPKPMVATKPATETPAAKPAAKPAAPMSAAVADAMDFLEANEGEGGQDETVEEESAGGIDPAALAAMQESSPATEAQEVIPLPENKAQITKLTAPQMNLLVEQQNWTIPNWAKLGVADKKKALTAVMFPQSATPAQKLLLNDPMQQLAHEIEQLEDQAAVEDEIRKLRSDEGINDFKLGGLLCALQGKLVLEEGMTVGKYIEEHFDIQYRKARYLMGNYTGLLAAEIPWDAVQSLGWTKLWKIMPVLTRDNVAHWVEVANANNAVTLVELVKQALGEGAPAGGEAPEKNFATKTFSLAKDQSEIVDAAVEDAMTRGKTQHKGTGLYYMAMEYMNGQDGKTVSASNFSKVQEERDNAKKEIAALEAKVKKLEASGAAAGATSLQEHFQFALNTADGDMTLALENIFGSADFEAVFPKVDCGFDIPDESPAPAPAKAATGGGKKTPAKKAA